MSPKFTGVVLRLLHDETEAAILRGLLERSGIRCALRRKSFAAAAGPGQTGPFELVVEKGDLERAHELVGPERRR